MLSRLLCQFSNVLPFETHERIVPTPEFKNMLDKLILQFDSLLPYEKVMPTSVIVSKIKYLFKIKFDFKIIKDKGNYTFVFENEANKTELLNKLFLSEKIIFSEDNLNCKIQLSEWFKIENFLTEKAINNFTFSADAVQKDLKKKIMQLDNSFESNTYVYFYDEGYFHIDFANVAIATKFLESFVDPFSKFKGLRLAEYKYPTRTSIIFPIDNLGEFEKNMYLLCELKKIHEQNLKPNTSLLSLCINKLGDDVNNFHSYAAGIAASDSKDFILKKLHDAGLKDLVKEALFIKWEDSLTVKAEPQSQNYWY